jgi:hypothetical protein
MKRALTVVALCLPTAAASAQEAYTDSQGRVWRQLTGTTGSTWDQVRQRCPDDGLTPCSGVLGAADLDGWIWATRDQVLELFAEFAPDITGTGQVAGPAYTLAGLGFFGSFEPTYESYTVIGAYFYGSGWSATRSDADDAIAPHASARYNPNDASFSVLTAAPTTDADPYRGVWLFRTAAGGCTADVTGDGLLNFHDLAGFLLIYADQDPAADLAPPAGVFDFFDVSAFLAAYNAGCP